MTGETSGYKQRIAEKAKFEHYPLGKVFNEVLDEKNKKERPLKRFKNTVDKNKEQLEENEYHGERQLDMINKHLKAIQKQEKQIKRMKDRKKCY